MKIERHLGKVVFYPIGLGILLVIVGAIVKSDALIIIGSFGLFPLAAVLLIAAIGLVWETADDVIPEFTGKQFLVGFIVLLFAAIFILAALGGGSENSPGSCPTYRGVPTCE